MQRAFILSLFLGLPLVGCGGGGSSSPSPSPTPTPQPTTFTLRGTVTEEAPFTSNKVAGAKVEFVDGTNAGKSAITDAQGTYEIRNANQGGFTVRTTASGFNPQSLAVTLTRDVTLDFALGPAGPRKKFGPGQYRVNTDIAPGRYYSVPEDGCYFERERGFSGSLNDIIANEFIGFDANQWIVDIKGSDVGFKTDEGCGIWYNTPRAGAQGSTIRPGMWLVGSQLTPGRYRASTQDGCYWERLKDFSNTFNGIIDNDFVSGGGSRIVEIRRSDLGFRTDDECGNWTRISGIEAPLNLQTSPRSIEENRALARAKAGDWRLSAAQ